MANTLFVGKVYHRFDELSSTNDYARDLLAKSKPPEGTVVQAASQSAGRGQFGSSWVSAPGENLTLSVILYPKWLPVQAQFRLNEAVALAVRDTVAWGLESVLTPSLQVRIKWPNDIWIGSAKAAGILIQNTLKGTFLQASIIGMGLNVNQIVFPESAPNAASLASVLGRPTGLDTCSERLCEFLEQRYLQLKSGNATRLRAEYHQELFGMGAERYFERSGGGIFRGLIHGVSDDGRLQVVNEAGHTELFGLKEIKFLSGPL